MSDTKINIPNESIITFDVNHPNIIDVNIKNLKFSSNVSYSESKQYNVDENGKVKDIKEPELYIQNKKLALTISKAYNIDYDISQKIVSMVSSETIRAIKEVNENG